MTKKPYLIIFTALFISSCTTGSITFQNLYTTIEPLLNPDRSIPEKYNSDFPYAFASVRVGRGQLIYVVLSEANNNVLRWISEDGFEIRTVNGKIIGSDGFERNISFRDPSAEIALSNLGESNYVVSISSEYHSEFDTNMSLKRTQSQSIIKEDFEVNTIKWKGTNKFYLNENGKVYKSINSINPLMPNIEMYFYKIHKDH